MDCSFLILLHRLLVTHLAYQPGIVITIIIKPLHVKQLLKWSIEGSIDGIINPALIKRDRQAAHRAWPTRSASERNVNRQLDSYYLPEQGFSMTDIVSGAFKRRGFPVRESLCSWPWSRSNYDKRPRLYKWRGNVMPDEHSLERGKLAMTRGIRQECT